MLCKKSSEYSESIPQFWASPFDDLLKHLKSSDQGLTAMQADERLQQFRLNQVNNKHLSGSWRIFFAQFKSPIVLILLFATTLSFFLHDKADAAIIFMIILISGILGFWQEKGASDALAKMVAMVQSRVTVIRSGVPTEIAADTVVPGDILVLKAGDLIPADCLLIMAEHLFVDEAILTGESFPVVKSPAVLPADTPLNQRHNVLWMGTHVQSGNAKALVINTGQSTEFGKLSNRLRLKPPETEFERGIRLFGYMLMEVTLILVILIFAINVYLHKPVMDSFLFALALAVGLTPQLLPAIISINLAHGAKRMASEQVIVKRLSPIENFGSMEVLCSDKTGTLTEGRLHLENALDYSGMRSEKIRRYAYLNAYYETGFNNPIDEAIRSTNSYDTHDCVKLDEIPYDFYRKRLSIIISDSGQRVLISKGALTNLLSICTNAELHEGTLAPIESVRTTIESKFHELSSKGLRILGVAYKPMHSVDKLS